MRLARRAALVSKPWAAGRSSDHQLGVVEGGTQASTGIRAELKPRGAVRVHVHVDHAGATELEDRINTREIGEVYDPRVAPPEATSPGEQIVERSGSRQPRPVVGWRSSSRRISPGRTPVRSTITGSCWSRRRIV